jgi:hypothetical protein
VPLSRAGAQIRSAHELEHTLHARSENGLWCLLHSVNVVQYRPESVRDGAGLFFS